MEAPSWFADLFAGRVQWLRQTREHNCVQTVLAMALGLPIELVEDAAGTTGSMTVGETLHLLAELGVFCRPVSADLVSQFWSTFYRRSGGRRLRGLGFRLPEREGETGHAYLLVGAQMYDPASGQRTRVDAATLRTLDWLAILPEGLYRTPSLRHLAESVGRA